ncbi:MAG: hypothetical protein KDK70_18390 [Myxococcales bacterium]|nr:hypothetical protein [Myxococcales bacterium]
MEQLSLALVMLWGLGLAPGEPTREDAQADLGPDEPDEPGESSERHEPGEPGEPGDRSAEPGDTGALRAEEATGAEPSPPSVEREPTEPGPTELGPTELDPSDPVATEPVDDEDTRTKTKAKTKAKTKKKKYDVDVHLRVVAGGRVRATHPSAEQPETPKTTTRFELRQTRVKVEARYRKILRARASIDVADFLDPVDAGDVLRDAWGNIRFHRAVQLKLGQFKRPYSRLELRGVSQVPFIGRGLFNGLAIEDLGWGDRALGAALWGTVKPERPGLHHAGWSVSASHDAVDGAPPGIDVHARGTYDPLPWLSIALGGAFKQIEDPLGARRRVFGASGDVTAQWEGLYASVEVDAAQDWTYADFSPWVLGTLGYVSYEWAIARHLRLQPVLGAEFMDANLSFAQSEAWRFVANFNVLWRKYVRVLPQVEIVRPRPPVTDFNRVVASETYGVWVSFQL